MAIMAEAPHTANPEASIYLNRLLIPKKVAIIIVVKKLITTNNDIHGK